MKELNNLNENLMSFPSSFVSILHQEYLQQHLLRYNQMSYNHRINTKTNKNGVSYS